VIPQVNAHVNGAPPGLVACSNACSNATARCGAAAANKRNASQQASALQACQTQGEQCAMRCASQGGGGAGGGEGFGSGGGGGGGGGFQDDGDPDAPFDAASAIGQVLAAWRAQDANRLSGSEAAALASIGQFMQALCQTMPSDLACTVGATAGAVGPPPPPFSTFTPPFSPYPPAGRFGSTSSQNGLSGGLSGLPPDTPSKKPDGCYTTGSFVVSSGVNVGNSFGALKASLDRNYNLTVANADSHDAYVGPQYLTTVPKNTPFPGVPVPIGGFYVSNNPNSAQNTQPVNYELDVKYWTTDPVACANGGIHPGPVETQDIFPDQDPKESVN
jgi:hypothetical protein